MFFHIDCHLIKPETSPFKIMDFVQASIQTVIEAQLKRPKAGLRSPVEEKLQ